MQMTFESFVRAAAGEPVHVPAGGEVRTAGEWHEIVSHRGEFCMWSTYDQDWRRGSIRKVKGMIVVEWLGACITLGVEQRIVAKAIAPPRPERRAPPPKVEPMAWPVFWNALFGEADARAVAEEIQASGGFDEANPREAVEGWVTMALGLAFDAGAVDRRADCRKNHDKTVRYLLERGFT